MTLQQLRDLTSVLAHGGFRSTARALSVSQAGLTKSVARLEEECGFALLDRTAKGIGLTPRGEAFLPYAQAVLGECDRAQQWITDSGKRPVRRVALGLSIEPSLYLAPSVLADFRRTMPEVTVHVWQSSSSALVARLRDNSIDLAVTRCCTRHRLPSSGAQAIRSRRRARSATCWKCNGSSSAIRRDRVETTRACGSCSPNSDSASRGSRRCRIRWSAPSRC
jgi:DNA-binding transcriptional LysR family regulator